MAANKQEKNNNGGKPDKPNGAGRVLDSSKKALNVSSFIVSDSSLFCGEFCRCCGKNALGALAGIFCCCCSYSSPNRKSPQYDKIPTEDDQTQLLDDSRGDENVTIWKDSQAYCKKHCICHNLTHKYLYYLLLNPVYYNRSHENNNIIDVFIILIIYC
ncbi:MAG: hypothetical protein MHMPM18_002108 [Marteilia pararefringens]